MVILIVCLTIGNRKTDVTLLLLITRSVRGPIIHVPWTTRVRYVGDSISMDRRRCQASLKRSKFQQVEDIAVRLIKMGQIVGGITNMVRQMFQIILVTSLK